jgi:hypothetical protein
MGKTGGCLCGKIRYTLAGDSIFNTLCHCPSCRRAAGAPVVAWTVFPSDALQFTGAEPTIYESSPGVTRAFCSSCGTPIYCQTKDLAGFVDMTVNSLDEPETFQPQMNIWHRYKMKWLSDLDSLESHPEWPPMGGDEE